VAVALLIGAVAGGIATLFLAPQSGAQMRGRLRRAPRDLRERGGHRAHDARARAVNMKPTKS
jgi:gas vesicle protein